jgi:hypothetical protein
MLRSCSLEGNWRMRLQIIERDVRATVQGETAGYVWAMRGRDVVRRSGTSDFARFVRLPRALPRDLLGRPRPLARASRADQALLYPLDDTLALVGRAGVVYRATEGHAAPLGEIRGDCPLRASVSEQRDGALVLGEYFMNPHRRSVRVWRVNADLRSMDVLHEFGPRTVRHVHGVFADSFDPACTWVTTGDEDGECYLWRTLDDFRTLERIGDGTQRCRAVRPFFTRSHVVWFTDSNLQQNHLMSLDRATGAIQRHPDGHVLSEVSTVPPKGHAVPVGTHSPAPSP